MLLFGALLFFTNSLLINGQYENTLKAQCSDPWPVAHSYNNFTSPAYEGSVVQYHCLEGHQLIGSPTRRCVKNGTWVPETPVCISRNLTCEFPGHAAHTIVRPVSGNYYPGQVISYSCEIGYVLVGRTKRVCQPDGKWAGLTPYCATLLSRYRKVIEYSSNVDVQEISTRKGVNILDGRNDVCSVTDGSWKPSFWKVDLLESYSADIIVLIFGTKTNVPIKLSISSNTAYGYDLTFQNYTFSNWTESLSSQEVTTFYEYKLIKPLDFQYIKIEAQPTNSLRFCELLVLSKTVATSEGQCFADGPGTVHPPNATTSFLHHRCYTYMHTQDAAWGQADENCKNQFHGRLASDVDDNVQDMFKLNLESTGRRDSTDKSYWIGGISGRPDYKGKLSWDWQNGAPIRRFFWGQDQPNMHQNEDACISLSRKDGWQWNDRPCTSRLNYVCQHSIRRCGIPEVPHQTFIEEPFFQTTIGSNISYKCLPGYFMEGKHNRQCLPNGQWSGFAPFCIPESQRQFTYLGTGVIIGIVCGVILAILLLAAILVFLLYRKKKSGASIMKFSKQTESAETLDVDEKKGTSYASTDETK